MNSRKRFLTSCGLTFAACALPAAVRGASAYRIDAESVYPNLGLLRSVTFPATGARRSAQILFAALERAAVKTLIVQAPQNAIAGSQLWQIADRYDALVAVNGGFFLTNSFAADGLLVVNGRRLADKNGKFSGAVTVDADGNVSLLPIAQVQNAQGALQTGPFLIDPGAGLGIHSDAFDEFRRSFIAQRGPAIVTGITSPLSLYQLADILSRFPQAFGLDGWDSALNLGGAATAAFFARLPHTDIRDGGALNSPAVIAFQRRVAA